MTSFERAQAEYENYTPDNPVSEAYEEGREEAIEKVQEIVKTNLPRLMLKFTGNELIEELNYIIRSEI